METTEDPHKAARPIHDQLMQVASFSVLRLTKLPHWYGRALSEILLLSDGEEIVYVTGRYDNGAAEIVVITKSRVVRSAVSDIAAAGGDGTIVSKAWSRKHVTEVSASTDETVFGDDSWPGHLVVRLRVTDGPELVLPIERVESGRNTENRVLREILRAELDALA
jgi:hypothetical protein